MSKQFREWWIREYADLSCGESQISERPDEGFDVHVIEHAALLAEQERAKGLVEALERIVGMKPPTLKGYGPNVGENAVAVARQALRNYNEKEEKNDDSSR